MSDTRRFHKVHIVRVERSVAGVQIPFDKLYIFAKQDADVLPRVFNTAMVFPLTAHLLKQLTYILVTRPKQLKPPKTFSFSRWNEEDLAAEASPGKLVALWTEHPAKYLALVPVLFTHGGTRRVTAPRYKSSRKAHVTYPAYLIARPDNDATVNMLDRAMSTRAYFISDGREIRPMCLLCPKHQRFLQGHCHLGEADCYRHLSRAHRSDFIRGLCLADELATTIAEPALGLEEGTK